MSDWEICITVLYGIFCYFMGKRRGKLNCQKEIK